MKTPHFVKFTGLSEKVTIYEVGARDGLQNEHEVLSVETKAEFVRQLVACGLRIVELTSFVPAKRYVGKLCLRP